MLFLNWNGEFSLDRLQSGESATLIRLESGCGMRRRLLDMGLTPGVRVECLGVSPGGDPRAYLVRGAVLALRREDCRKIILRAGEEDGHGTERELHGAQSRGGS